MGTERVDKKQRVAKIIICVLLAIWLFVVFILSPLGTAVGVINGDLDIDTLEPAQTYEYKEGIDYGNRNSEERIYW